MRTSARITDHFALEGGYLQKFFGDDAQATQFFYFGLRGAFRVGS